MELNGFVVLAAIWILMSLISRAGRKSRPPERDLPPPRTPRPRPQIVGRDPTQQEGSRLEIMLRELQRSLEAAGQQAEEGRSIELEPEAISLEETDRRSERHRVDQDDEAEQIVARRIQAAAERETAQAAADHPAFDQRIRQEPAEHTAVRTYTPKQLRDAVVWREILGRPVSER